MRVLHITTRTVITLFNIFVSIFVFHGKFEVQARLANGWDIGEPTITSQDTVDLVETLSITHTIGIGPSDVEAILYDVNCENPITNSLIKFENQEYTEDVSFSYDLVIDTNEITGSNPLVTMDSFALGSISLCVRLNTLRSSDNLAVTFRETNYFCNFDLSTNEFAIDLSSDTSEIVGTPVTIQHGFSVDACICDDNFDCWDTVPPLDQNTIVSVCMIAVDNDTPTTEAIISGFGLTLENTNGLTYEPVSIVPDGGYVADGLTVVNEGTISDDVPVTQAKLRLVSRLFDGVIPGESITIFLEGEATIALSDTARSARESTDVISTEFDVALYVKLVASEPESSPSPGCRSRLKQLILLNLIGN